MKTRWYRLLAVVVLGLVACLWVSAAVAEEAKPAPAAETKTPVSAKDVATFVVRNGGMTQGIAVPADWDGRFGDCTVSRDTAVFKEGPASLCVSVAGGKSGQAFQRIVGMAGQRIKIAGFIKCAAWINVLLLAEGDGKAWLDEVRDAAASR